MHLDHALRAAIISALEFQRDNTLSQSEMDKAQQSLVLFQDHCRLYPVEVKKLIVTGEDLMELDIKPGEIRHLTATEVRSEELAREAQARIWREMIDRTILDTLLYGNSFQKVTWDELAKTPARNR